MRLFNMASTTSYTVAGFTSVENFTIDAGMESSSYDYYSEAIPLKNYFEILFMAVCGAVGIIGNGTLILIVLLNADMRNVPNTLIASLAMGDFVFLVSNVPITIASYTHMGEYPYSEFICKLSNCIPFLSEGVSVLTLGALSFDRYNAIVRPMHRRRSNAVRQTYLLAFSIWVLATLLATPGYFLADKRPFSEDMPSVYCFPLPHGTTVAILHEILRCLFLYVFPLAIISLFYTLIALKLLASSRDMPGESRGDATKQVKARRRLARSVIVLVALFAVCWLPHFIYQFLFQFKYGEDAESLRRLGSLPMSLLQTISHYLIYINSSINPIAMCFLSKTYRRYFAIYLCFCWRSRWREQGQKGRPSKNGVGGTHSKWTTENSIPLTTAETKTCVL